ncbi:MAG: carboxypeptidase regulatory-like domain-containing protein [Bacteroidota bacterium]
MKKLLTYIAALCLPALIIAQSPGEIKGKIIDAKTNEILPGATVFVKHMGALIATQAGKDGTFTLKPLDPGTYNVYVTFITYDTLIYPNVNVIADKPTFVDNLAMTTDGVTYLVSIDITAIKPIEKGLGNITVIPKGQLDQLPDSKEISSILRCTMTDVYVSDDGDEIYFRGSRDGDAIFIVDGVKMRDNQIHIPGNAIGSIAVYTGGVPANYGDFTGGVVVIETQSYFSWLNDKKAKEESAKSIF